MKKLLIPLLFFAACKPQPPVSPCPTPTCPPVVVTVTPSVTSTTPSRTPTKTPTLTTTDVGFCCTPTFTATPVRTATPTATATPGSIVALQMAIRAAPQYQAGPGMTDANWAAALCAAGYPHGTFPLGPWQIKSSGLTSHDSVTCPNWDGHGAPGYTGLANPWMELDPSTYAAQWLGLYRQGWANPWFGMVPDWLAPLLAAAP